VEDIEEFKKLRDSVREVDEECAENTRVLYARIDEALDEYQNEATGHGNFERYVEFRSIVIGVQQGAKEQDIHLEEGFEKATDRLDRRTLQQKHFTRAHNDLEEVRGFIEDYEQYKKLRQELEEELHKLERKTKGLDEEIEKLKKDIQKAQSAEGIDVSRLREKVETYNRGITEDFDSFVRQAPAVKVARLGERVSKASLLEDIPIEDGAAERLLEYVDDETVEGVLELADSSDGKLSHYFEDLGQYNLIGGTPPGYNIFSQNKITSMDQLDGKVFRSGGGLMSKVIENLGGSPVETTAEEIYETLNSGTAAACILPGVAILDNSLYEVTDYKTSNLHLGGFPLNLSISASKFDNMPDEVSNTLMEVGTWTANRLQGRIETYIEENIFSNEEWFAEEEPPGDNQMYIHESPIQDEIHDAVRNIPEEFLDRQAEEGRNAEEFRSRWMELMEENGSYYPPAEN